MSHAIRNEGKDEVYRFSVSPEQARALDQKLKERIADLDYPDIETHLEEIRTLAHEVLKEVLGQDITRELRKIVTGDYSVLHGTGFPDYSHGVDTPVYGYDEKAEANALIADAIVAGILNVIDAQPVSYDNENDGRLVRNVVANPAKAEERSSHGSKVTFSWHVDNPQHPFDFEDGPISIPRYLGFYGMRNTENVPTEILGLQSVLGLMDRETIEQLSRPVYSIAEPDSNTGSSVPGARVSILSQSGDGPAVRFEKGKVSTDDPEAEQALGRFQVVLDKVKSSVSLVLKGGHFLLFDNYKVLHRRSGFEPNQNPARSRWLRRIYGARNQYAANQ